MYTRALAAHRQYLAVTYASAQAVAYANDGGVITVITPNARNQGTIVPSDEPGGFETPELVSIKEAAERLGISVDTVRRRLKRGELEGAQHPTAQGFTWLIAMPTGSASPELSRDQTKNSEPQRSGSPRLASDGATMADLWRALEEEGKATIAAKDETIGRLAAEVAHLRDRENAEITFLREQLDQRSRELAAERERFDVIQQLALQRIEALTATVADQRQDAPERAAEPPGSTQGVSEGDPASWWTRTWKRMSGGS